MLSITKDIEEVKDRHGLFAGVITGDGGIGKSVYALLIAKELYLNDCKRKEILPTEDECWEWSIKQIVHGTKQLALGIKGHTIKNKRLIIIWDDASVGGGKYDFSKGFKGMSALSDTLNLVRSACDCLLLTTISYSGLAKFIKDFNYKTISITKSSSRWTRVATTRHKVVRTLNSGIVREHNVRKYRDYYNCHMPDRWYDIYIEYREKMLKDSTKHLIKLNEIITKKLEEEGLALDKKIKEYNNG